MDNRAIGVFDSGLGGLTAVKELMHVLPHEDIIYFGDTGRVPYGTRSAETLLKYVSQDIRFLKTFDIKMIVIACGTASTVVLPRLAGEIDIPIVGVVDEAARAAAACSVSKRIGVIATNATINSGMFQNKLHALCPDARVYAVACPLFVPLVENGHTHSQVARLVAEEYLSDLRAETIDTLIMGCTHYPLLRDVISETIGKEVSLIDVGRQTACYVKRYLSQNDMLHSGNEMGKYRYFVSDTVDYFSKLGSMFLQREIGEMVNKIDIETY